LNSLQSRGAFIPSSIFPHRQPLFSLVLIFFILNTFDASNAAYAGLNAIPLFGIRPISRQLESTTLNTFVNIFASSIGTLIAVSLFGTEYGVLVASVGMTVLLLIFGEVTPKTLAALYPEQVALPTSYVLQFLLWILYPLVWTINTISNGILKLCGVKIKMTDHPGFSSEELRTLVLEASSLIPSKNRKMLLSILDLENITVDSIMIPRNEVVGIYLDNTWSAIVSQLSNTQHTFLPVYEQDLNHLVGVMHAKKALPLLGNPDFNESMLRAAIDDHFLPVLVQRDEPRRPPRSGRVSPSPASAWSSRSSAWYLRRRRDRRRRRPSPPYRRCEG